MQITACEVKLSGEYPHVVPLLSLPRPHIRNTNAHTETQLCSTLWHSLRSAENLSSDLGASTAGNMTDASQTKRNNYHSLNNRFSFHEWNNTHNKDVNTKKWLCATMFLWISSLALKRELQLSKFSPTMFPAYLGNVAPKEALRH